MFKNTQKQYQHIDRMKNSKDFQDYSENSEILIDQLKYKDLNKDTHAQKSH